jgi:signal transduction histidine kinase
MSDGQSRLARFRLGQWFGFSTGLLAVVAVLGVAVGVASLSRLTDARQLLADRLDPAATAAQRLNAAMLNEETGVRGYLLTGRDQFLDPWTHGRAEQAAARRELAVRAMGSGTGVLRRDLAAVDRRASDWVNGYALPTIDQVRRNGRVRSTDASLTAGKARFDALRAALGTTQANLQQARDAARDRLDSAAHTALGVFIAFGALLILAVILATVTLRRVAIVPMGRLAGQVRTVARGEFDRTVQVDAAREIVELGEDIDRMRRRIVAEAADLQRSNAELEQFAYVASHDLQEPLRKVASFCQLLQTRYRGSMDERADQYIDFAVDGAKRMQVLINDLLAFSRVGRAGSELAEVDLGAVVRAAEGNLAGRIEDSGATVEVAGELPTVQGDPGLLTLVFQNLIGNAIKFRGDDPPHVTIGARHDEEGDCWQVTVADNGIGIDSDYAERIFVIFQRLHSRASYEGTGIGLAMCRKIIEHHGGRIWLSQNGGGGEHGATFAFTLPAEPTTEENAA